jgi:hypothetical protein
MVPVLTFEQVMVPVPVPLVKKLRFRFHNTENMVFFFAFHCGFRLSPRCSWKDVDSLDCIPRSGPLRGDLSFNLFHIFISELRGMSSDLFKPDLLRCMFLVKFHKINYIVLVACSSYSLSSHL